MEEDTIVERLSDKSKSLRRTSVKKRLQTEINKKRVKVKDIVSKKRILSKYRWKAANAKERERMKKMNDVFAKLKSVIPADNEEDQEEEKETKVTTLRSAVHYLNYLKSLIQDCDAGLLETKRIDLNDDRVSEPNIKEDQKHVSQKKKKEGEKKIVKTRKLTVKSSRPIILDTKWTNYSQKFLEQQFSMPENQNQVETEDFYKKDTSYQNIVFEPLPDITTFYQVDHHTSSYSSSP